MVAVAGTGTVAEGVKRDGEVVIRRERRGL